MSIVVSRGLQTNSSGLKCSVVGWFKAIHPAPTEQFTWVRSGMRRERQLHPVRIGFCTAAGSGRHVRSTILDKGALNVLFYISFLICIYIYIIIIIMIMMIIIIINIIVIIIMIIIMLIITVIMMMTMIVIPTIIIITIMIMIITIII